MQCQMPPRFLEMGLFTVGWQMMFLVADMLLSMLLSLVVSPESHDRFKIYFKKGTLAKPNSAAKGRCYKRSVCGTRLNVLDYAVQNCDSG